MKFRILLLFFLFSLQIFAQQKKHTISGRIIDLKNGEDLIGAVVYVDELKTGTTTNAYGYYSLSIPSGNYTISVSYMGYETQKK
ncbi:MAG: carboxypeptidase-like regulatory domain-containing protein, partial [Bacteroidota bacterium]